MLHRFAIAGLCSILLLACSHSGRYQQHRDSLPRHLPENVNFDDAVPVYEPYSPANLRPYRVFGKDYLPLTTGKGFEQQGEASWYGEKFHGHLTANGETYDMYAMTAAHKTLPLPSFVRVTNLQNGRKAVVRVNDRGPFHGPRIMDLSYAAALKLGFLATGVARVKLEVMHMDQQGQLTIGKQLPPLKSLASPWYVQVTALTDQQKLQQLASGLSQLMQVPASIPDSSDGLYRLRLGPLEDAEQATQIINELKAKGYQQAYKLQL